MSDRIAELEAQLQAMARRIEELEGTAEAPDRTTTRRGALRGAALAAGGAIASGIVGATPARAADGSSLVLGTLSNTCTSLTQVNCTGSDQYVTRFVVQSGSTFNATSSTYDAALGGWAAPNGSATVGVYAYSARGEGSALAAFSDTKTGSSVTLDGPTHLRFMSAFDATLTSASYTHKQGDLVYAMNALWICTVAGTPGTFRRVSGVGAAGAFTALTPFRAYDSRVTAPTGQIVGVTSRVISVKDAHAGASVSVANVIPAGATAVTGNLTVTNTSGAGYLAVMPGNAASLAGSTINWAGADTRANGFVCALDGSRQLKIFSGGGACDFIIDITGYYQ